MAASEGEIRCLRTRRCPNNKKAGRFPIRTSVGPTKNLLSKRQRDAQQDTETLWSLAGLFRFWEQKAVFETWSVYRCFCWNNHWNELRCRSPLAAEPESTDNLSPCDDKVKPETGNLSTFFYISARALAHLRDSNHGNAANPAGFFPLPSCRCRHRRQIYGFKPCLEIYRNLICKSRE